MSSIKVQFLRKMFHQYCRFNSNKFSFSTVSITPIPIPVNWTSPPKSFPLIHTTNPLLDKGSPIRLLTFKKIVMAIIFNVFQWSLFYYNTKNFFLSALTLSYSTKPGALSDGKEAKFKTFDSMAISLSSVFLKNKDLKNFVSNLFSQKCHKFCKIVVSFPLPRS